jgi:phage RecT family recombinase
MENQNNQQQQVDKAINAAYFAPIAQRFIEASGLEKKHFEKEVSFALQLIHGNKRLADCTQESFLKAVLNIANVGLTLNPVSKYAYLVPRYNNVKRVNEACLEPSYVGLVKLLTDSGSIKNITATLIYDNDQFEVIYGMYPNIVHKPVFGGERGNIKGVYAVATLHDGSKQFEVMTTEEVHEIRSRSESWRAYEAKKISTCVWVDDEGEMFRKTVIKRIYKYLPKTERMQKVQEAIEVDNTDYTATPQMIMYIDELVRKSTLTEERKQQIEYEMSGLSAKRAEELIIHLQQSQQPTLNEQYKERLQLETIKEEK